jgi:hypothetical protein
MGGQRHAPVVLLPPAPGEELWYQLYKRRVGPRAGLDGSSEEKVSCPHRGLNPEASSLHRITMPTILARPPDIPAKGSQIRYRDLEHRAAHCFIGKRIGCVLFVVFPVLRLLLDFA